jgi:UDP-N-acetyl-D-glucosamine dehydrogenase
VVDAAATKPFGFMPFYPGPGIGGHCIPLDPHYLAWKMKTLNYRARFIELASEINAGMPEYWVDKVWQALNDQEQSVKGADILVIGVAYKPDIDDVRESPALDIIALLQQAGAHVTYHDPHVAQIRVPEGTQHSVELTPERVTGANCVVIATDHRAVDHRWIAQHARRLVDTRNTIQDEIQSNSDPDNSSNLPEVQS